MMLRSCFLQSILQRTTTLYRIFIGFARLICMAAFQARIFAVHCGVDK